MLDNLEQGKISEKFHVPYDEQKKRNVKQHEEDPQNGIVPANSGQQECVVKSPEPPRPFLGKDLQRRRMSGFPQQFHESYPGTYEEDRKCGIYHWYQYDIIDSLHSRLSLHQKSDYAPSMRGHVDRHQALRLI